MASSPAVNGKVKPDGQELAMLTMSTTPSQEKQRPFQNGKANGITNGTTTNHNESQEGTINAHKEAHKETRVPRSSETRTTKTTTQSHVRFSKDQQVIVLKDTVVTTRRKFIAEYSHVDEHYIDTMTIESFVDYIERQRLTHMPHRGSMWDKVLKWAEFYALQISGYEKSVSAFVEDSKKAAKLTWTASRLLLELGPGNAQALETAFGVFYKLGLSLSFFLRHHKLLSVNAHIRGEVGEAFNDMLLLVREVSIYYRARINSLSSGSVAVDFNTAFRKYMEPFYRRKNHIIDAMWKHSLGDDVSMDFRTIRRWLSPRDRTTQTILNDRLAARGCRDEYTCEWFQRHLLDFSRSNDDVLSIVGPAGCGKSVLAGWIVERLQRPLGRKRYEMLSYTIEADIPSEATSLAVAKNISLQLLEINVGDEKLFNALVKIYNMSVKEYEAKGLEDSLWEALDAGLEELAAKSDNLMVVIDGLDEVEGGQRTASAIRNRLGTLASKHERVRVLILSKSQYPSSSNGVSRTLGITSDHTHYDMHHIIEHALRGYVPIQHLNEFEKERIVEHLLHEANGSFLWALLTIETLKKESTSNSFMKALKEAPNTLDATLNKLTATLDFSKSDTKLLLSWLLVAERPLTVAEVKCLLQVDLQKKTFVDRNTNIIEDIGHACGSLVINEKGILRFRHGAIRSHLKAMQIEGKKLLNTKSSQSDLVMRVLAYSKFCLTKKYEPAFDCIDMVDVDELFKKHLLLEYTIRYWISHFQNSSMHRNTGSFEFTAEFKAMFPSSSQLAMIEWACWEPQTSAFEAVRMHDLSLRIRQDVFSEKHESVLQTLIICGTMHRKSSHTIEAGKCFYRASHISQATLHKYSSITISCATRFLECTEMITSTTRTEILAWKEEMLKFVIEGCKHTHGRTSDIVIRYYKILAQLYVDIHEEHQAAIIWRELREIIIVRHGKGSKEETSVSKELTIILKKENKQDDVIEYEKSIFETSVATMEVWDIRSIKIRLELAMTYESHGELFLAEEIYITLWRLLTEHCHHHHKHGVEIHIHVIDVALEYARFLRRCGRHEEASSILICVWTEYEEYDFESEAIFLRLKIVGELMRSIGLLSIAVFVFKRLWGWFKAHDKHEHEASCVILISETVEEMISTTTTVGTTTTTTSTTVSETVIKEVFESSISRTTVTSETISICQTLISYYIQLERWTEAIEVTKRSLTLIWKVIVTGGGICALPRDFGTEAIDIAIRFAICYYRLHHFHEAEEIYVRVYRACRHSCHIHDERLTKSSTTLIKFYEEHKRWHKMIEIYKELLVEYHTHLGASHTLTIKTLYTLGSLCTDHGHGRADEYYEEIITVLNKGSNVCHHGAIEAMIIVSRRYYEEGSWHKLKDVCKVLWETWVHHHHEHQFEDHFIEELYMRYVYVLEHHSKCEYETLRIITIEYHGTCVKIFGTSAAITIKAMIELAQICMRSEKHIHEAIAYYEEVITKTTTATTTTTTVVSTTTIATIKERLTKAYVTVCSHGSTTSTTIERAIKVISERFEYLKVTFGCSHYETLTVLRELVLLYSKMKTEEAHSSVLRILLETTIEIVRKEKHSKKLHEGAVILGGIYIDCGLSEHGIAILREMRRQIVTRNFTLANKFGFKIEHHHGKISYVFLVTFESILRGSTTTSYSETMADLLAETVLYEQYTRCLKSETNIEIVLTHGARLRTFLLSHHRHEERKILEKQTFEIFTKKWGSTIKTSGEITFIFYVSLLEELGKGAQNVPIGNAACLSGSGKVRILLEEEKFDEAYDVAQCAFDFLNHQRAYHHLHNVGHGFKLSGYMAGRGLNISFAKTIKPELREKMLELSRTIIREVLHVCKDSNINFVRLQLGELNDLVGLLGAQKNYTDLEWLLKSLWSSREVQKTWSATTIVSIGRRLAQARFLADDRPGAIRLCEDICYNLRRVKGSLDKETLKVSELLSQLYTEAGHTREAMGVHEEILRLVVEGDDDDDKTLDTMEPQMAKHHLDLLKRSYQRLGGWDKNPSTYKVLVDDLIKMYHGESVWQGVQRTEKWNAKETPDTMGKLSPPLNWEFAEPGDVTDKGEIKENGVAKRPGKGVKRARSSWGIRLFGRLLHDSDDDDVEMATDFDKAYNNHLTRY